MKDLGLHHDHMEVDNGHDSNSNKDIKKESEKKEQKSPAKKTTPSHPQETMDEILE